MVVLSAAILNKSGKVLVARQFVEVTRMRVEGLLSSFTKILGGRQATDHTYFETEAVRYIYQPLEFGYLVLVTNKSSNIVEDLDVLRLLAKVLPEFCVSGISEDAVLDHAFDIIFAFDEVQENLNLLKTKLFFWMMICIV